MHMKGCLKKEFIGSQQCFTKLFICKLFWHLVIYKVTDERSPIVVNATVMPMLMLWFWHTIQVHQNHIKAARGQYKLPDSRSYIFKTKMALKHTRTPILQHLIMLTPWHRWNYWTHPYATQSCTWCNRWLSSSWSQCSTRHRSSYPYHFSRKSFYFHHLEITFILIINTCQLALQWGATECLLYHSPWYPTTPWFITTQ